MNTSIMDADTASPGAIQATDDQLGKLAGSLLESLNKGGGESIEAPLDQIYHYFREKTWKKSTSEALLQTWSACALLLNEDPNPEACARSLHILRSLAQFCTECGTPVFEDWTKLDVGTLVGRIAACMQRHPESITLQTTACALLSRLAGCSSCHKPSSTELVAAVGDAGAVQALAQAVTSLQAQASQVPAATVCASEALTALRLIADGGSTKLDLIVDAGGVDLITAARAIAQGQGNSDQHVLYLMARIACRPQASFQEALAASNAAIDAAQAICNSEHAAPQQQQQQQQHYSILRALWSISLLVTALMSRQDGDKAALSSFAERSAGIAVGYLKQTVIDFEIAHIWVRFLGSLVCCIAPQDPAAPTVTSTATASLVANELLQKSQSTVLQSSCLCTLWNLLLCCQPLDTSASSKISQSVGSSITILLKSFTGLDTAAAKALVAVGMVHGLACIGSLGNKDALPPSHASLALTSGLSVLSNTEKNALIDSTEEWDASQITWAPLSGAVHATVDILLAAGPAALNAAYGSDGFTLVHQLAGFGQSKCLEVVLQSAGDSLDLLARTKSGATALQLARQGRHTAAAALLEEVTQRAAEARQTALLEELEAADKDDSARKAKKKKSVTRSASFAAEQPDEKSQKTEATAATAGHYHQGESATAAAAAEQARAELRQRLEEEYERALEERRMELAKQQQMQTDLNAEQQRASSMAINSDTSSAENPSTPRAMLEADISASGNGGHVGADSGSNSNSGAEDDLLAMSVGATTPSAMDQMDVAVPAPVAVPSSATAVGGGSMLLRRTPSELSPFSSPDIPLPSGGRSDLNSMGMNINSSSSLLGDGAIGGGGGGTGNNNTTIQREHSLFGSPSLTGNLFGSYGSGSPGFSTGLHAASSPSTTTAPGFNNNSNNVFGTGLTNEASGLPDALFIHHSLTAEDMNTNNANNNTNANLLASLAGTNTNTVLSSPSSQTRVVPQMHSQNLHAYGQRVPSIGGTTAGTGSGSSDGDSDASSEPTRHLWIGNLGTRTPRAVLKAVFEAHGVVEDVVTFPGRMYAFVNYCTTEEAIQAINVLQNQVVPDLTGDRPLLLKYRPVKKAEMHLRSLGDGMLDADVGAGILGAGFGSSGGLSALAGSGSSLLSARPGLVGSGGAASSMMSMMMPGSISAMNDPDGNCSDPSPRIWLGNIAPTATSKTLQAVLGQFGPLTDAAVFPARIGPLGYAFVKFEALEDAVRALETLNNTVVPPLSGSKQLKMRYKPAASGPAGREESLESSKSQSAPSRHLWLGNITQKPSEDIIFQAFSKFGRVDSARVFPAKAYAFVNFSDINAAVRAMAELEGVCIPCLTGVKPLVMRFQQEHQQQPTGPPPLATTMRTSHSLANIGALGGNPHMARVQSESALALAASLNQLVPGGNKGLSDDHPHGLVGVVPNTNGGGGGGAAGWGPEQAAQMHRSASLNLLNQAAVAAAAGRASATPASSPFNPNLMGMPESNSMGSASTSQLSAVLNNLAALQRAASVGNTAGNAPAHQDIANLSSMLASQSLASSHDASMSSMRSAANTAAAGWNSGAGNGSNGGLDGLLCPLSNQLMTDPVVAADGVTYHRPAISEWLASQTISPVLQTPLAHGGLVPNHAVKDAVLGYLRMQLRVAA